MPWMSAYSNECVGALVPKQLWHCRRFDKRGRPRGRDHFAVDAVSGASGFA
jgi:hypothetical protein